MQHHACFGRVVSGRRLPCGAPSAACSDAAPCRRHHQTQQRHKLHSGGRSSVHQRTGGFGIPAEPCHCRNVTCSSTIGAATPENPDDIPNVALSSQPATAAPVEPADLVTEPEPPQGVWARIKRFFGGDRIDRQRLAALGMGAVCSYGLISNVTYGGGMAVAWIAFVKRRGVSPLGAGQWQAFLAFYAGYWTIQHFVRPLRFALAVSIAPFFDRAIQYTSSRLNISRRNSFGLYLIALGTCTSLLVFGSIAIFAGPGAFAR